VANDQLKAPSSLVERDIAAAVRLADWLDDRYIDPIVGFVFPGAGDLVMAMVGLYPVWIAIRRRMPGIVVARMLQNLAIDLFVGAVPILGDAFDFVFKAHRKNADLLLERRLLGPSPARDWAVVLVAVLAFVIALSAPLVALALLIRAALFHG